MVDQNSFWRAFNVSRETVDKVALYYELLQIWNKVHNLVQRSDLDNFWQRHATDSAQLVKSIHSPDSLILDLGSGAGFPGLILSILTPNTVLLFESNQKKIVFLEHIIHTLNLSAKVIPGRIEDSLKNQLEKHKGDIIVTSRALGSLTYLLSLVPSVSRETTQISYLLHKNKNQIEKEIPLAKLQWDFDWKSFPSITQTDSAILAITHVTRKS